MLKISLLQIHPVIGNVQNNTKKILDFYNNHKDEDLVITPELALCGYSPLDNLYSLDFQENIINNIEVLKTNTINKQATLILGTTWFENNCIYNVALVITNGKIIDIIYKTKLPNYGVFNEHRYFTAKESTNNIVKINNYNIAIFVCEDMWHKNKVDNLENNNIDIIISINASPFEISNKSTKHNSRLKISQYAVKKLNAPLVYLNLVQGVDDIIFDGSSFLLDSQAKMIGCLNHAKEDTISFIVDNKSIQNLSNSLIEYNYDKNLLIYETIILGLRDFLKNTGFNGVIIGMSGGIDSTLTATIAVDAIGAENVLGIAMPSKYTSSLSHEIIDEIKNSLGIKIEEIYIDNLAYTYEKTLESKLNLNENNILDNIQARIRGQILMAYSNQNKNMLVLTTGNKSEIATGYSTIYGDTCGAYNLLKDLYKTEVFNLSKWRNKNIPSSSKNKNFNVIPQRAITRKPSAELKENQYDEDSLMDYNILDAILYSIIEKNSSVEDLYKSFDTKLVNKVISLLKNSHYKRLQSAPGVNISTRPFGKAYQYNISDNFIINGKKND